MTRQTSSLDLIVVNIIYFLLSSKLDDAVGRSANWCRENIRGCYVGVEARKCSESEKSENNCHLTESMIKSRVSCKYQMGNYGNYPYDDNEEVGGFSSNLTAVEHLSQCGDVHPPALNLSWSVEEASLKTIEGFFLNISFMKYGKQRNEMRTFWINKQLDDTINKSFHELDDTLGNEITFVYDCFLINYGHTYDIQLHTLPLPRHPTRNNSISTSFKASCDPGKVLLSKWKFCLHVDQSTWDPTEFSVHFLPAPIRGYKTYKIQVTTNINDDVEDKNYTVDGPQCLMSVPVVFKLACPNKYKFWLMDPAKQLSWMSERECEQIRTTTRTTTTNSETTTRSGSEMIVPPAIHVDETKMYVYVSIGGVFGIPFFVLCILCYVFKNRRKFKSQEPVATSVILIYSSDTEQHRIVMHRFATFLNCHFKCEVRFDAWHTEEVHRLSSIEWLLRKINSVDNVVIVHSEGSFKQYKAYLDGKPVEKLIHDTPLDDMFIPAVKEFQNQFYLKEKKKRFYQVYFPYTEKCHVVDLKLGKTYRLMDQMEDLFLDLHGVSNYNGPLRSLNVIKRDRFSDSIESNNLKTAIKDATRYFSKNKDWFTQTYRLKNTPVQDDSLSHVVVGNIADEDFENFACVSSTGNAAYTIVSNQNSMCDRVDQNKMCDRVDQNNMCDSVDRNNMCDRVHQNNMCDRVDQNNMCDRVDQNNMCDRADQNNVCDIIDENNIHDRINRNDMCDRFDRNNLSDGTDSGFVSNMNDIESSISIAPGALNRHQVISKPSVFDPHGTILDLSSRFCAPDTCDILPCYQPLPSCRTAYKDGEGDMLVRDRVFVSPFAIDSISHNFESLEEQIKSFNEHYDSTMIKL